MADEDVNYSDHKGPLDPTLVLPVEVFLTVLTFLNVEALARSAEVSRTWQEHCNSDFAWNWRTRLTFHMPGGKQTFVKLNEAYQRFPSMICEVVRCPEKSGQAGTRFTVREKTLVGRSEALLALQMAKNGNALSLGSTYFVMRSLRVSSVHFLLEWDTANETFNVTDQRSHNGTQYAGVDPKKPGTYLPFVKIGDKETISKSVPLSTGAIVRCADVDIKIIAIRGFNPSKAFRTPLVVEVLRGEAPDVGQAYAITAHVIIGRSSDALSREPCSDGKSSYVFLHDPQKHVSRRHLAISCAPPWRDHPFIVNCLSKNRVYHCRETPDLSLSIEQYQWEPIDISGSKNINFGDLLLIGKDTVLLLRKPTEEEMAQVPFPTDSLVEDGPAPSTLLDKELVADADAPGPRAHSMGSHGTVELEPTLHVHAGDTLAPIEEEEGNTRTGSDDDPSPSPPPAASARSGMPASGSERPRESFPQ